MNCCNPEFGCAKITYLFMKSSRLLLGVLLSKQSDWTNKIELQMFIFSNVSKCFQIHSTEKKWYKSKNLTVFSMLEKLNFVMLKCYRGYWRCRTLNYDVMIKIRTKINSPKMRDEFVMIVALQQGICRLLNCWTKFIFTRALKTHSSIGHVLLLAYFVNRTRICSIVVKNFNCEMPSTHNYYIYSSSFFSRDERIKYLLQNRSHRSLFGEYLRRHGMSNLHKREKWQRMRANHIAIGQTHAMMRTNGSGCSNWAAITAEVENNHHVLTNI